MRRLTSLVVLGAAFAVLVPVASATRPSAVTVHVDLIAGSDTWTASGAITDSGTSEFSRFFRTAIPSPSVGVSHADIVFEGAAGSFTLRSQSLQHDLFTAEGTWVVLGGTGAYAGIYGEGKVSFVFTGPGTGTAELEGGVHYH